jgi:hypothetical protein
MVRSVGRNYCHPYHRKLCFQGILVVAAEVMSVVVVRKVPHLPLLVTMVRFVPAAAAAVLVGHPRTACDPRNATVAMAVVRTRMMIMMMVVVAVMMISTSCYNDSNDDDGSSLERMRSREAGLMVTVI